MNKTVFRAIVSLFLISVLTVMPLAAQSADAEVEHARQIIEEQKDKPAVSAKLVAWLLGGTSAALLGRTLYLSKVNKQLSGQLKQTTQDLDKTGAKLDKLWFQTKPMYYVTDDYLASFNKQLQQLADEYVYSVPRYLETRHPGIWKVLPEGKESSAVRIARSAMETVFSKMEVTKKTVLLTHETPAAYFKRVIEPKVNSLVCYMLSRHYEYYGALKASPEMIRQTVGLSGRKTMKVFPAVSKTAKVALPLVLAAWWGISEAQDAEKEGVLAQRLLQNPELFLTLQEEDLAVLKEIAPLREAYIALADRLEMFNALPKQQQQKILQQAEQQENMRRELERENLARQLRQAMSH